ncbi:head-tail connector protein [Erythrobacter sp. HA6-11]
MMRFGLAPFDLPGGYGDDVVSLEDIKNHVSMTGTDEFDSLLTVLRDAAIDQVERYCGVRLQTCEGLVWKSEALCAPISLGVWPVTGITSIKWLDSDAAEIIGDPAIWRIGVRDQLRLKPGQVLPSGVRGGVEITFDAGFTSQNRPSALVHAVKMFTAHLFANREAVLTGTISGEIPLGFRALCQSYRMPVL